MEKNIPEVVFGSSDRSISKSISRMVKSGELRKLMPRVYTSNFHDPPEVIVGRNLYLILGKLFPGALLSHRTAIEGKPTEDRNIFLTYKYTKKIELPGFTVRLMKGPDPSKGDMPFLEGLFISSEARAYLENMQVARGRGSSQKSLHRKAIEERLNRICQIRGEEELNQLLDRARKIAGQLNLETEFRTLNKIISALLRTSPANLLKSPLARARAFGRPYDQNAFSLFELLFSELKETELPLRQEKRVSQDEIQNMAFFEAYFSNYIEGTLFEVEEAREIIFKNKIPVSRPSDAHDIIGTFRVVSNTEQMKLIPDSPQDLFDLLKSRHSVIMGGRPDNLPGEFKREINRAGQKVFVEPELVIGTLEKGFEIYQAVEHCLGRAIFMKFLVAEIHPFTDGNGRIARIMMNAELVQCGRCRIIIPTVYREDYLLALRALSRTQRAAPFIRMLTKAQEFSAGIDFSTFEIALGILRKGNAFEEYIDDNQTYLKFPSTLNER